MLKILLQCDFHRDPVLPVANAPHTCEGSFGTS